MPVTEIRKTLTRAKVIDDNLNSWVDFAGVDINLEIAYRYPLGSGPDETSMDHWSYRGQASVCQLPNGNIIRVRVGDGTNADSKLYIQTITDPTDPTQWTTWSTLYTLNHIAVAVIPDPTAGPGYRVVHSKDDGLYIDNALISSIPGVVKIKPVFGATDPGFIYIQMTTTDDDGFRQYIWQYNPHFFGVGGIGHGTWYEDCVNYRWYRHDMVALQGATNWWYRFRSLALDGGGRNQTASETLTCETINGDPDNPDQYNLYDNVRYLQGPSKQDGFKTISNLYMTSLPTSDNTNMYFLFYNQRERDINGNVMSNLKMPLFWSRSIGYPYYLSMPTPTGFSIWGFAGVVKKDNYIYVCGNGRVLRRYWPQVEIDITDYVVSGSYQIPRGHEKATGQLVLANPDNAVGVLLGMTPDTPEGLTNRRLWLELGKQLNTEIVPNWHRDSSWWVSNLRKSKQEGKQQLILEFADFWFKLENKFLDIIYNPGKTSWVDWGEGGVNELYNWFNDVDDFARYTPIVGDDISYTIPRLRTSISGTGPTIEGVAGGTITLFKGWTGESGILNVVLWNDGYGVVFRYMDANNFMYVMIHDGFITLHQVVGGTDTIIQSDDMTDSPPYYATVDFRWNRVETTLSNGDTQLVFLENPPSMDDGRLFAGWWGVCAKNVVGLGTLEISNVNFRDLVFDVNTKELVTRLLAYGEEHGAEVSNDGTTDSQVTLTWGPQSDLDTPEKALQQLLDSAKIESRWLPD